MTLGYRAENPRVSLKVNYIGDVTNSLYIVIMNDGEAHQEFNGFWT